MKRFLLLFFPLLFSGLSAQVVFCPPGAKWTAAFSNGMWSNSIGNRSIVYAGDSIIGGDTLKSLVHTKFLSLCNYSSVSTLVKQKGDTVFIKNRYTQHTWQTLFNFACQPGQGWLFTYTVQGLPVQTYSYTVDSTGVVYENGFFLKCLYLKIRTTQSPVNPGYARLTERYGWEFLFSFQGRISGCDGDGIISSLCYSDDAFGVRQFTSLPCDYNYTTGLDDLSARPELKVYPVPCQNVLIIDKASANDRVSIIDLSGRCVLQSTLNSQKEIDLSSLQKGTYLLVLRTPQGKETQRRLIKE